MNGITLIRDERTRQVSEEGWTPEHDDEHELGEMAAAAMCYAEQGIEEEISAIGGSEEFAQEWWPFDLDWWKPSDDRIRNLVKAGALIAAEIDRLQRLQWRATKVAKR